jgi:hypothetical protein
LRTAQRFSIDARRRGEAPRHVCVNPRRIDHHAFSRTVRDHTFFLEQIAEKTPSDLRPVAPHQNVRENARKVDRGDGDHPRVGTHLPAGAFAAEERGDERIACDRMRTRALQQDVGERGLSSRTHSPSRAP